MVQFLIYFTRYGNVRFSRLNFGAVALCRLKFEEMTAILEIGQNFTFLTIGSRGLFGNICLVH